MSEKSHVDGSSLPFPPQPSGSIAGRTMQESVYSPKPAAKHLPEDAPNILIVLIDDAGPGLPDIFGGEVHTPTLERVYNEGIGYNRFHTTAMCSPTQPGQQVDPVLHCGSFRARQSCRGCGLQGGGRVKNTERLERGPNRGLGKRNSSSAMPAKYCRQCGDTVEGSRK